MFRKKKKNNTCGLNQNKNRDLGEGSVKKPGKSIDKWPLFLEYGFYPVWFICVKPKA